MLTLKTFFAYLVGSKARRKHWRWRPKGAETARTHSSGCSSSLPLFYFFLQTSSSFWDHEQGVGWWSGRMQKKAFKRETFSGWGRRWGWFRLESPSAATFVNSVKLLSAWKRKEPRLCPCLWRRCRIVLSFVSENVLQYGLPGPQKKLRLVHYKQPKYLQEKTCSK